MVTAAEADFVVSACETALTVTGLLAGTADGGVYIPEVLIVPTAVLPPVTPATAQFTCVLLVLLTVAVNWVGGDVVNRLADVGLMATDIGEGGGDGGSPPPPELLPPPHDNNENTGISRMIKTMRSLARPIPDLYLKPRRSNPVPNSAKAARELPLPAGAIALGPSVLTVMVTVVVPVPGLIGDAGLRLQVGPASTTGVTAQV